jgi:hypothetical protein
VLVSDLAGPNLRVLSEVHSSDMLKAHEGNLDTDPADPARIHWAKWNLVAKFIAELVQIQAVSRAALARQAADATLVDGSTDPDGETRFAADRQERAARVRDQRLMISNLWRDSVVMTAEVRRAVLAARVVCSHVLRRCSRCAWRRRRSTRHITTTILPALARGSSAGRVARTACSDVSSDRYFVSQGLPSVSVDFRGSLLPSDCGSLCAYPA